ncbi:MAG: translesion DNA synthesis-associated protein ImuA [Nevskiaceae bacterium]|jgi:cell division inhibitor SulA/protein ImuA|nr:translesion DNA synthesis-associated protein ImuA [Nevskiaceae bacterium]
MPEVVTTAQLDALLRHPGLWRARHAAPQATFPTGYEALDRALPGGGWPVSGLIETLVAGDGCGELRLWAPLIAQLTQAQTARCCALICPPFELYAPAWQALGVRTQRLLVVRGDQAGWAMEQSLLSGACALVFGWIARLTMRELRRLALAAQKGAAIGVLIRPSGAAREHSAALLRLALESAERRCTLRLLKGRGIAPQVIELELR